MVVFPSFGHANRVTRSRYLCSCKTVNVLTSPIKNYQKPSKPFKLNNCSAKRWCQSSTEREFKVFLPSILFYHLKTIFFFTNFRSKMDGGKKYAVSLSLNVPKSDLLTFAIFSRDYRRDMITNGVQSQNGATLLAICLISSIFWMKWSP